jgi:hypothetical protein
MRCLPGRSTWQSNSAKDMQTFLPPGLAIGAYLEREGRALMR